MPLYPQGGGLYPNSIDNVILTDMADSTVKGRAKGAGLGDPQDLTATQLSLLLGGPNFRNILGRNGGFEVWQRGAGGSAGFTIPASGGQYTADGWYFSCGANQQSTVNQFSGTAPGSRSCMIVTRNTGQTGITNMSIEFPLDIDEIVPMRGQIVTLSMTLHAGATFSPTGSSLILQLFTGTASPSRSSGLVGPVGVINQFQAITTTPTRYSVTSSAVVPANATQAMVLVVMQPIGTAGANDAFAIDDVQLEVGSVATPFERRFFDSELLACQRHFQKSYDYAHAPGALQTAGEVRYQAAGAGGESAPVIRLPVRMRAHPTTLLWSAITGAQGMRRNYSGVAA